jgi:hypothetical protein
VCNNIAAKFFGTDFSPVHIRAYFCLLFSYLKLLNNVGSKKRMIGNGELRRTWLCLTVLAEQFFEVNEENHERQLS